ncbi:MAG: hypothetical protein KKG47_09545 [Proteobacteria bacterium]|nr:hypothetical protein [Pseudomonadota bacterium]MBU1736861.1 hypothetical protein [Pseudomonadota bacterium]
MKRYLSIGAFLLVTLLIPGPGAHGKPHRTNHSEDALQMAVSNNLIDIAADSAPLISLLEELAGLTDIEIYTDTRIFNHERVSIRAEDWTITQVLNSLLKGYNFVVVFPFNDRGGRLDAFAPSYDGNIPEMTGQIKPGKPGRTFSGAGKPQTAAVLRSHPSTEAGNRHARLTGVSTPLVSAVPTGTNADPSTALSPGRTSATTFSSGTLAASFREKSAVPATNHEVPDISIDFPEEDPTDQKTTNRINFIYSQIARLEENIKSGYSDKWYAEWTKLKDPRQVQHDKDILLAYVKELETLEK